MLTTVKRYPVLIGLVVLAITLGVAVYGGVKGYYNSYEVAATKTAGEYYTSVAGKLNDKVDQVVTSHDTLADRVATLEALAKQFQIDKTNYDAELAALKAKVEPPTPAPAVARPVPVYRRR
jgi:hypothetical protein